jgi:hypothetical protein
MFGRHGGFSYASGILALHHSKRAPPTQRQFDAVKIKALS